MLWHSRSLLQYDQRVQHLELLEILRAGVAAVRPSLLFPPLIENRDPLIRPWLESSNRYILTIGKAALESVKALDRVGTERYFVLSPYADPEGFVAAHVGTHPIPDEKSYAATSSLLEWLNGLKTGRLLVVLSGGTSALCVRPVQGLSLASKMKVNDLLLRSGATIQEINSVRKHLSEVKGGRLATRVSRLKTSVLVISDVIGNDLSVIGSGLFYPDPTTFLDAKAVLVRYGLWSQVDSDVRDVIESGCEGALPETPKPGSIHIPHTVVASNDIAREAAAQRARSAGYTVREIREPIQGDVHAAAETLSRELDRMQKRSVLMAGGEVTVRLHGNGSGGRNQHLSLLMAAKLNGKSAVFAAMGTDGVDGNSNAAGAWADGATLTKAGQVRFDDALNNCDSFHFFQSLDQTILTGPTGTNVMDLYAAIKY